MTSRRNYLIAASGGLAGLVALGALWVTAADADGIPEVNALSYSGTLEALDGTPLTGSRELRIELYNAVSGGAVRCTVTQTVALSSGRFQLVLPDTCTAAVRAEPNLWVDVAVDGESLGRTKLGAVPYAVEAAHAVTANSANSAAGGLATQLVPTGAVMAFDLAACPAGWTALADVQGRVIVGSSAGLPRGTRVGADQVTLSVAQMPAHRHTVNDPGHAHEVPNTISYFIAPTFAAGQQGIGQAVANTTTSLTNISLSDTGGGQAFENRQASLALLYCKKS